jgi:hypothetical protein
LTSSSSQVVADIQVIHAKLKLNGFLLAAGVVELTLAFAFLTGWTFIEKAVVWGYSFGGPFSLLYWVPMGLAFFVCGGQILSGAKNSLWILLATHLVLGIEFVKSYPVWESFFKEAPSYTPWISALLVNLIKSQAIYLPGLFLFWTAFAAASLYFSRRHLVN